ncbi:NDMA-dependent alcohol dehydrogenase [Pseudonocardia sp. C8]|uniref:NDMA-dependent alcohol dehydrogenase n=1 Tax=Pseudonocardia sp. C8 TaxID=2762759 RepID=UPI0016431714|nr:NDMA-dependent alcohol dehydrogenase [Pseudonocardia sp. C8]
MLTRAAVLQEVPGSYQATEVELEDPRPGEIRVKMKAAGMCHSDDHFAVGTQQVPILPIVGGHEGAGIVDALGPGTTGFTEGDHVVFSFLPVCGRCWFCSKGMQNLCRLGASIGTGARFTDPTSFRMSMDGKPVGQLAGLGVFSEYVTVHVESAIRIDESIPFDVACLTGCGVGTGWGAAVNSAEVRPGQVVIVMGIGGIGINAVQGAAHAGADVVIAVDPVPFKRESALKLGATHAFADIAEAADFARSLTDGQGADSTIVTVGILRSKHVGQALESVRKAGTVVVTGLGDSVIAEGDINLHQLTLYQKRLQGSLFGASAPLADIPAQLEMYRRGTLKLEELITTRYTLDQVPQGYDDMNAGRNLRGVVVFD